MTNTISSSEVRTIDSSESLSGQKLKSQALIDLLIYREQIKKESKLIDTKVENFKKILMRNLSVVVLTSIAISYVIMWWKSSDLLIFFSVVLVELFFILIFGAYIPRLLKFDRYKTYQNIQQEKRVILDLLQISDQLVLCVKSIMSKNNDERVTVNYVQSKGRFFELLKRIRNLQVHNQLEVIGLVDRNSLPIRLESLLEEYDRIELYQLTMNFIIPNLLENDVESEELDGIIGAIKSRTKIDYDEKHLRQRPEWTKNYN